jgi:surface carbohydrate biosynthesis protein (TIGR04326 family)
MNLIISDRYLDPELDRLRSALRTDASSEVLGMGYSADCILSCSPQARKTLPLRSADERDISFQVGEEVRQELPRLLNLARKASSHGESLYGIPTWKLFDFSEKNLWLGPQTLIPRFYNWGRAAATIEKKKPKRVVLHLEDSFLCEQLAAFCASLGIETRSLQSSNPRPEHAFWALRAKWTALRFAGASLFGQAVARLLQAPIDIRSVEPTNCFFTYYPYFWSNPFDSTKARDRFFQEVPQASRSLGNPVFLAWATSLKSLWRQRGAVRSVVESQKILFLQSLLNPIDALRLMSPRVLKSVKRVLRNLEQSELPAYRGLDFKRLVAEEIRRSACSYPLFATLLQSSALKRALLKVRPSRLIYRLEFQPFEAAIAHAAGSQVPTWGFQHSAASRNFLSYVFSPNELSDPEHALPAHILTTGPIGADLLVAGGAPASRVTVVGPVRYSSIRDFNRKQIAKTDRRRKLGLPEKGSCLYIAASPLFHETASMIASLSQMYGKLKEPCYFIFKSHPTEVRLAELTALMAQGIPISQFKVLDPHASFYEYLSACDGMILTGSTVGAESIAIGVPPIIFECAGQFANNSLIDFPDAALVAWDADSLYQAVLEILNPQRVKELASHWPKAVDAIFGGLETDPVSRFIDQMKTLEFPKRDTSSATTR